MDEIALKALRIGIDGDNRSRDQKILFDKLVLPPRELSRPLDNIMVVNHKSSTSTSALMPICQRAFLTVTGDCDRAPNLPLVGLQRSSHLRCRASATAVSPRTSSRIYPSRCKTMPLHRTKKDDGNFVKSNCSASSARTVATNNLTAIIIVCWMANIVAYLRSVIA